jgi:hypothetical protein
MTENAPREPERPPREERYPHHRDEKEEEKTEEKGRSGDEKNWDEKWRRDPINAVTWAAIFIWAGLVLLAKNIHLLSNWNVEDWPVIFIGVGVIILLSMIARFLMPAYRRNIANGLIPGLIFLGVGLSWLNNWNWDIIWPIILIAVGLSIVLGGIFRKRK